MCALVGFVRRRRLKKENISVPNASASRDSESTGDSSVRGLSSPAKACVSVYSYTGSTNSRPDEWSFMQALIVNQSAGARFATNTATLVSMPAARELSGTDAKRASPCRDVVGKDGNKNNKKNIND